MIDFTGCKVLVNSYEGADFKRKIIYDGDVYMLKFGQKLESDEHKPLQASYTSTPPRLVGPHLRGHLARRYLHVGLLSNRESYLPSLSIA